MQPEICRIGFFTVYSYGLMLVIAFGVGSFLAASYAKSKKINPEIVFNCIFTAFISGVAGARLFYIAENAKVYLKNPLEMIMLQHGGLSWFGGLIAGALAGFIYLKIKKQPVLRILDIIVPYLALAQAIGRVGCLLNGCCYGKISKFGLYFPVHEAQLIPTQIYSALLLIFIFLALRILQERPHKSGEIFYWYLLLYSVKRFFIEFWRADNPVIFSGLTLFQIFSASLFLAGLAALIYSKRSKTSK